MLTPGTRLGAYEIGSSLGAGGMGEVYRATDIRLGREVAIKVLPSLLAQDADRLARFDREARTVAALNHPNIASIHDPEEAFVASLSSCHMLWFLFYAAQGGFVVDSYNDTAEGHMEKTADGNQWMSRVFLRPDLRFAGSPPDAAAMAEMHDKAHHACFIANSVKTTITVEAPA